MNYTHHFQCLSEKPWSSEHFEVCPSLATSKIMNEPVRPCVLNTVLTLMQRVYSCTLLNALLFA